MYDMKNMQKFEKLAQLAPAAFKASFTSLILLFADSRAQKQIPLLRFVTMHPLLTPPAPL